MGGESGQVPSEEKNEKKFYNHSFFHAFCSNSDEAMAPAAVRDISLLHSVQSGSGVTRPRREANHLRQSSAEVMNERSFNPAPSYVFVTKHYTSLSTEIISPFLLLPLCPECTTATNNGIIVSLSPSAYCIFELGFHEIQLVICLGELY